MQSADCASREPELNANETLQMRNFEKLGMTREQAERLTIDVTEILCINKEKIAAQFVSKSTLEKVIPPSTVHALCMSPTCPS